MNQQLLSSIQTDISQFLAQNPHGVIVLRGTTATGKTELSVTLSDFFPCEIISSDSRQIFRYMDIGTDKISKEIRARIPHWQIDIVNPDQHYTAGQRYADTKKIIPDILARQKTPLIVGGTGLYIDTMYKNFSLPDIEPDYALREKLYAQEEASPGALHTALECVDPVSAAAIHPNSTRYLVRALEIFHTTGIPKSRAVTQQPVQRPLLMLGLWRDPAGNEERIRARVQQLLHRGLINEVQWLLDQCYDPSLQSMQGIGYKQTVEFLQEKCSKDECIENICIATRQYAKRQRTWLRRYIADAETAPRNNVTYKVYTVGI